MLGDVWLALSDVLLRQQTSVANRAIAEVDGQPSVAEGDANDPKRKSRLEK
jgi:hypothetical protein